MNKIRYWAIASLFAPLGLIVPACYQDPADAPETDPDAEQSEYTESELNQDEAEEADPQVVDVAPVCRPGGWQCYAHWQCCSGACFYGQCAGGGGGPGPYCRVAGTYCNFDGQCCSGNCWGGQCRGVYY
jgi:hypothetical protein